MTQEKLHKMEMDMTKVENTANKYKRQAHKVVTSWKAKLLAILIGITLFVVMLGISFYTVSQWYESHSVKFHVPVEVQVRFFQVVTIVKRYVSPVIDVKTQEGAKESQILTQKRIDRERLVERLYQYVRYLESEIGFNERQDATHIYCQNIGKVNEIGYFPNGNKKYCFSTEEKQLEGFMFEYNDRMKKGYTLNEFLCEWVTGTKQPQCKRSMDIGLGL